MRDNCGVAIEAVQEKSIAEIAGMKPEDRIISINGNRINDSIDLMFHGNEPELDIITIRNGKKISTVINVGDGPAGNLGIVLKPFKIRTCRNNCIFCFVAQLPRGLRKSLYIKDEDFRMSFLFGSYITLTNLSETDRNRIVEQRLSPLYISVHSTDAAVRNEILSNPKAADIMKELRFFADNRIMMHTQIVLCPGYNDGKKLENTIRDLYHFYPFIMSIAVVPLGLTGHRKKPLKPVEKDDAIKAIETIMKFQLRFRRKHGERLVFGADELYIKAGVPFPSLDEYEELPQIENGVGMVPLFLRQAKKIKFQEPQQSSGKKKRFLTFTALSFYPYLSRFSDRIRKGGFDLEVAAVENTFFGKSVTVTGLLTGRDVIKSLSEQAKNADLLLIPDVVMREGDEVFLDDVSRHDVENALGIKTEIIESTPQGLADALISFS